MGSGQYAAAIRYNGTANISAANAIDVSDTIAEFRKFPRLRGVFIDQNIARDFAMESSQDQVRIRPARAAELPKLAELVRGRLPDLMKPNPATQHDSVRKRLAGLLPDEALLLAIDNRKLSGMAALDLDHSRILAMYLDPKQVRADTARQLIASIEDTARAYGIQRLNCTVKPQAWAFMERMGYQATGLPNDNQPVDLSKRLFDEASGGRSKSRASIANSASRPTTGPSIASGPYLKRKNASRWAWTSSTGTPNCPPRRPMPGKP